MITVIHVDTERTWRGGEKQVFHLVSGLPQNEFKSIIAAPVKSALYDKAIETGITVIPLRSSGEVSIRQFLDLKRGANRYNANLFHVHSSHGLISASIVREISKNSIKVIYSRRTDFHLRTSFLNISKKKYLWGTDRIISVSDGIKRVLALDGIPENRVTTIYSGINPDAYSPEVSDITVRSEFSIPMDVPLIGMVSALAHHKEPINFLRAA